MHSTKKRGIFNNVPEDHTDFSSFIPIEVPVPQVSFQYIILKKDNDGGLCPLVIMHLVY